MQRGFEPILFLIAILVIGALGYGGYYFVNQQKPQTANENLQQIKSDKTEDWKTYSTDFYSFKYPSDWREINDYVENTQGSFIIEPIDKEGIFIEFVPNYTDADQLAQQSAEGNKSVGRTVSSKEIQIAGKKAVYQEAKGELGNKELTIIDIYIKDVKSLTDFHPTNTLVITMANSTGTNQEQYQKALNDILSTFKFLDQSAEGKVCGGFAGNLPQFRCPEGYKCQLPEDTFDAQGVCVKK